MQEVLIRQVQTEHNTNEENDSIKYSTAVLHREVSRYSSQITDHCSQLTAHSSQLTIHNSSSMNKSFDRYLGADPRLLDYSKYKRHLKPTKQTDGDIQDLA